MWQFIRDNSFIVGALSGGVAAYVLSLIIGYLTREKRILGFSVYCRKVVEQGHKEIKIEYLNQSIQSLHSIQITVGNVGNRALKEVPITLCCEDGKIVDTEVTGPRGISFNSKMADDCKTLIVTVDLLNSNENLKIGLTVIDFLSGNISVTGVVKFGLVPKLVILIPIYGYNITGSYLQAG